MAENPAFELGPIRPPSEAQSLLLRCTRNCPWNRCEFCHTYRGRKFQLRTVDEVKCDIDAMASISGEIRDLSRKMGANGRVTRAVALRAFEERHGDELWRTVAAWLYNGPRSAFLQDANSLIMKTDDLVEILLYLKAKFPVIERITSYARSHTLARKPVDELLQLREAGLTRIHIGMESGCDEVLKLVQKGVTAAQHIEAGRRVKAAGMELSEYVMPGLGGKDLSEKHAVDTACALNEIDPDFIRLRSLALPPGTGLHDKWVAGEFTRLTDDGAVREIRLFISRLEGIHSILASDHILNLLEDLGGRFPGDKAPMLGEIDRYLSMPDRQRLVFKFGRRTGRYRSMDEMEADPMRESVEQMMDRAGITDEASYENRLTEIMMSFI
jgi:hypothetical protein